MSRPLRIEYQGAWYHVLNRGRRREKIFYSAHDYRAYLDLVGECSKLYGIEIHSYSLLPNHYHLLIRTPLGNLSRAMRHLDGVYTQKFNRYHGQDGSIFRGRYKAILVEEDSYLKQLVRYIHQNPLKAGLEKTLGQHAWTSHKYYIQNRSTPDWLYTDHVLSYFGTRRNAAARRFNEFVKDEVPEELLSALDSTHWPAILGGKKFKDWVKEKHLVKWLSDKEITQSRAIIRGTKISELKEWASKHWGIDKAQWCTVRRGLEQPERRAMIYVSRWNLMATSKEISQEFGGIGHTAISKQCRLARIEIAKESGCFRLVNALQKYVKCQVQT